MAQIVTMKNPQNGLIKNGFFGFSWTYLFFGWLVPLFRGELGIAALHCLFTVLTAGIWQIVFCFLYNRQYTSRLIADGFRFADRPEQNRSAAIAIGADLAITSLPSMA